MNSTAFVTIVSNNYLHFARTLMQSVAAHHPEADRFCVVVDRDLSHAQALAPEFALIPISQLALPDGDNFLFQYTVLELNTAVKPWALAHLLQLGYQNVVYIDPDIVLYRPLEAVFDALNSGSDLVLTPHLLATITDKLQPSELDIRRAGTYNLGFCALRTGNNMQAMLTWWQGKLRHDCVVDHDRGVFVDQSWMDLVPGLFPHVCILRHPGYNLAYWNLAQRPVTQEDAQVRVCGQPLVFFHFSGLNPTAPAAVSKHQNRYSLNSLDPLLAQLITDYCERVIANGLAHYSALPYAFACFDDGTPITEADRRRFRTSPQAVRLAQGRPFACQELQSMPKPPPPADLASVPLRQVYAHFLGRSPDPSGADSYNKNSKSTWRRRLVELMIGLSAEARSQPGWFLRLLSWPLQAAQLPPVAPPLGPLVAPQPTAVAVVYPERASPYGGLYLPEPDSPTQGLWVGPRLDLPVPPTPRGAITILGTVNLGLLSHAKSPSPFHLDIHGPAGLLHSAPINSSGPFSLQLDIPTDSLAGAAQWTILASCSVVPKAAGLGEDTRALAWRVTRIQVDDAVLIDSAKSPATQAIEAIVPVAGINLVGYLSAELGLGEGARSLARACAAAHIPFSAVDVGYQSQNLQRDTGVLGQAVDQRFDINLIYVNADQTPATSAYLIEKDLQARYRIGFWHWEQPQLPTSALGAFAHVDEVWVPSTFVHDAVAPYAPVPVVKIPHGIGFCPSPGLQRSWFGLPQDKLLVLVMYDFHSYQYRKNPQAAIAAYRQAAADCADVALVIKTINGQHHPLERQQLQQAVADLRHVVLIDDFLTRQQTWDLQACCDVLLSLHRAEGFGLAPAEMMYLGKPVIATGWSANTDFMTAENSYLVRYKLEPLQDAVGVYVAGQLWAEADLDHAAWCLRQVIDDLALRQRLGQQAALDIRRQLSFEAVGALVRQRLAVLGMWHPRH